jgi:hypothetical protein
LDFGTFSSRISLASSHDAGLGDTAERKTSTSRFSKMSILLLRMVLPAVSGCTSLKHLLFETGRTPSAEVLPRMINLHQPSVFLLLQANHREVCFFLKQKNSRRRLFDAVECFPCGFVTKEMPIADAEAHTYLSHVVFFPNYSARSV